jgi:hypothetical protein
MPDGQNIPLPTPDPGLPRSAAAYQSQQEGEQQWKENFGSPLEQAYGKAKSWLAEHEGKLDEKYLKPFRQGLDNMSEDLQNAAETGHTKGGVPLTGPTKALTEAAAAGLRMVPIGKNVKETAQAVIVPPEFTEAEFTKLPIHSQLDYYHEMMMDPATTYEQREAVRAARRDLRTARQAQETLDMDEATDRLRAANQTVLNSPERKAALGKVNTALQNKPADAKKLVEGEGLVYKGEVSPGTGIHMIEHPDHPGMTSTVRGEVTPESIHANMKRKVEEFGKDYTPPNDNKSVYRARAVGEEGVPKGTHPVATDSKEKAAQYAKNKEAMTGKPHEVVEIPLKGTAHTKHPLPDSDDTWYSFQKDVPEESIKGGKKSAAPETKEAAPSPSEKSKPKNSSQSEQVKKSANEKGSKDL